MAGHSGYDDGNWRCNRDDHPHERGEGESAQSAYFEQQCACGIEIPDGAEGEQEDDGRSAGNEDERKVDGAVQALFAATSLTLGEVLLVIFAHLRRETGNVISPSG